MRPDRKRALRELWPARISSSRSCDRSARVMLMLLALVSCGAAMIESRYVRP